MAGLAGWGAAVARGLGLASKIWTYFTGNRTREQLSLEAEGERALDDAKHAQSAHELNAADAELQRVQATALARKRNP